MDKISYSLAAKAIKGLLTKANIKGSSVLVPSGDTLSRPVLTASEVAIRYNTYTSTAELWDGLAWVSLTADITAVNLKGTNTEASILSITTAYSGDLWVASDTLDAWMYNGTDWINIGPLQGPQGVKGDQGSNVTSVVRTVGNGDPGTVDTYTITFSDLTTATFQVTNGQDGAQGLSAYEVALAGGFVGSELEWLESLKGTDGVVGSDGQDGTEGLSAYEVAVNSGFIGTELQWLESLNGVDGVCIDHVSKVSGTGAPGTADTYEVWLDAEETASAGTFTVFNGHSVDHVSKTSGTGAAGTTDTYTAWGDTEETLDLGTFVLYNGADGIGAIDDTTTTTTTLWSSSKTNSEILAMSIALG